MLALVVEVDALLPLHTYPLQLSLEAPIIFCHVRLPVIRQFKRDACVHGQPRPLRCRFPPKGLRRGPSKTTG